MINFLRKKNISRTQSGFTLIEMIIAVFIFTLSLAALMTVSSRGLKVAANAQRQVIADYLALEGIEGVRNIRDSELLDADDIGGWEDLFDNDGCWSNQQGSSPDPCSLVYGSSSIEIHPCSNCTVHFNESSFTYRQFPGSIPGSFVPSEFIREIIFTEIPTNDREVIVTVIVSWGSGRVEYTENLFLWL